MKRNEAERIAREAIASVAPDTIIERACTLEGETLTIAAGGSRIAVDLTGYRRIVVVGAGKASGAMAAGIERVLGDRIDGGVVVVKDGHTAPTERVTLLEAGHPVPDERSVSGARRMVEAAREADEDTLLFALISGGGSALATLPATDGPSPLSLGDAQETTRLLLGAGTPIEEINTVRKHLSGISGGRFCRIAAPARVVALILSDVVGDDLASIASGLAAPDPGTFDDALEICRRHGILASLPSAARGLLEAGSRGEVAETPKPGDPVFERVTPLLIGTNALALDAARTHAESIGYATLVLTSQLTGEAREIAHLFAALARDIRRGSGPVAAPACILAGGETTVTLRGDGLGGRNQEMALALLARMARAPQAYRGVTFLSVGTDGTDGPTDAAGAFAAPDLLPPESAEVDRALERNDSYHFFAEHDGLLKTGPTNTNVCDVQILLVEGESAT